MRRPSSVRSSSARAAASTPCSARPAAPAMSSTGSTSPGSRRATAASDTAHQVTVNVGSRPARIVIEGSGSSLTQSDLWWVNLSGTAQATADYSCGRPTPQLDILHRNDETLERHREPRLPRPEHHPRGRHREDHRAHDRHVVQRGHGGAITIIGKHIISTAARCWTHGPPRGPNVLMLARRRRARRERVRRDQDHRVRGRADHRRRLRERRPDRHRRQDRRGDHLWRRRPDQRGSEQQGHSSTRRLR